MRTKTSNSWIELRNITTGFRTERAPDAIWTDAASSRSRRNGRWVAGVNRVADEAHTTVSHGNLYSASVLARSGPNAREPVRRVTAGTDNTHCRVGWQNRRHGSEEWIAGIQPITSCGVASVHRGRGIVLLPIPQRATANWAIG